MVGDKSLELRATGPGPGPGEAGADRELFVDSSKEGETTGEGVLTW